MRLRHPIVVTATVLAAACGGSAAVTVVGAEAPRVTAGSPQAAPIVVTLPPLITPPSAAPATPPSAAPATPLPAATAGVLPDVTAPTAEADTTIAPPDPPTTPAPPPPPPPDPLPLAAQLADVAVAVELVAELIHPIALAWSPADGSLFAAGQNGEVWRFDESGQPGIVLDLTGRVSPFAEGSERGLLGLAFGPDARIYLNFTDAGNDTNVVSMAMAGPIPDPSTERPVLFVEQPGLGHNGGTLVFDATGNLYVAMGDGGASNGRDAQDPAKLLGAILRIRPTADGPGYEIPPDNPFNGHPEIRPEKWIYGFRNPWKFSIDAPTGDLWLGDVGNSEWEEIDHMPAGGQGANYGWYWYEGNNRRHSGAPDDVVGPVFVWDHGTGIAAIGGYVYRGSAIPSLRGAYVFGDLNGTIWALGVDGVERLPIRHPGLTGFGMDPTGELWMTSLHGKVVRIVPA